MRLNASSLWVPLEGIHAANTPAFATIRRSIHTSVPSLEARSTDRGSSAGFSRTKKFNEKKKQIRVSDTILTASRLGRYADSISKDTSDQYSGWNRTPGPSTRRNVGRPKLSRDASKSMVRALASESVEVLLGTHSAAVLTQPLLWATDTDEFGRSGLPASKISSRDFIAPRKQLRPGDFVEVRRTTTAIGIVLPPPDDALHAEQDSATTERANPDTKDLFILVASGHVVLFKENDVMMQIPGVIETELSHVGAVQSKRYVLSTNSRDTPADSDGSHDVYSYTSSGDAEPLKRSTLQEEPIDEPRFEARASICHKLRILERQKEKEVQRLLPSFQSLFLADNASQQTGEVAKLRKNRMDLRTGTITTFEAARLMHELQIRRADEKGSETKRKEAFTASTIYAAHSLLMSCPTHFLADALSHRTSQLFTCRTDAERANLDLIKKWIADPPGSEGQGYIDAFCRKAGKVREWAESHPHDASGPPRIVSTPNEDLNFEWTAQDRSIIEFLQASLGSRRAVQENTHGSIAMEIVKRAGGHFRVLPHPCVYDLMNVDEAASLLLADQGRPLGKTILETVGTDLHAGGDLQHALVMRFLTSIGALPPWQNPIRLDASFRKATLGEDKGEPEREAAALEKQTGVATEGTAKRFGLSLDQEVEAIRHDFGKDLTVFVIDDEGAFELDDGISIEPVKGRESEQAWVHVHIADPTAWIQPDDQLGQRAERRFQTLYFPEARWAMLPDDFVRSGVGLRSTTSTAGGEASSDGQRVMTFSALLDLSTGLVQDTKVRPALVHDVQTISYNQVGTVLADSSPVRGAGSKELSLLFQVASKLSENRARCSAFIARRPRTSPSVSPLPMPGVPALASALQRPYFFAGFPTIDVLSVDSQSDQSNDISMLAQFLVSEIMILAGRVAATYGSKHNLGLAYRHLQRPESMKEAEEMLALRTNLPNDSGVTVSPVCEDGQVGHGLVSYEDFLVRGLPVSSGGYSAGPRGHFSLGISDNASCPFAPAPHFRDAITFGGYVRATSPLRRYVDMLTHWQIKHHLVHGKPCFLPHKIAGILPQLERQEVTAKSLMRAAERFWLHLLLRRSLLDPTFEGGSLRGPFTAKVILTNVRVNFSTLLGRVRVHIIELGVPADLEWDTAKAPPEPGAAFSVVPKAVIMAGIRHGLVVRRV